MFLFYHDLVDAPLSLLQECLRPFGALEQHDMLIHAFPPHALSMAQDGMNLLLKSDQFCEPVGYVKDFDDTPCITF
jgi:hypothetical protein